MDNFNRIQFETPNLERLKSHYTVVDLHFHSHYSDGADTIPQIVSRARKLGIGIAITDHNEIAGAIEIDSYKDVLSIPGVELTSREGTHIVVYFYRIDDLKAFFYQDIQPHMGPTVMSSIGLDVMSIIQCAKKYDSVIIFPHPYSAAFTGICNHSFPPSQLHRLLLMADGVEVINSENLKSWNMKSALLGFNLDRCVTGGSDGHKIQQMGSTVTYSACDFSRAAFLDAMRRKDIKVMGAETRLLKKIQSNGTKLKHSIPNYPELLERNVRYGKSVIRFRTVNAMEKIWRRMNDKHIKKAFYFFAGVTVVKLNYNALLLIMFSIFAQSSI